MQPNNFVIIMAGGIGSRFWPFSRVHHPKQFHDVLSTGQTMLQQTAERFSSICPPENIYIVTNTLYKEKVKSQLPFLDDEQILLEPMARNTAPCVAYAAYKIHSKNPHANIVVAPADHVILHTTLFQDTIQKALDYTLASEKIVTLGIKPHRPDTGYGYIQFMEKSEDDFYKVKTFTEKPNLDLATKFLESGDFLWNAGIFIFNVKTITDAFKTYLPEVTELFEKNQFYYTSQEQRFIEEVYSQCRNISIDYGIMEKAQNVYVLKSDFGWSDLGTWKSLYDLSPKDNSSNSIDGNAMVYNSSNCIIKTPKNKLVVVHGLDGFIVAESDGVLMICKIEDEQKVKEFVSDAKEREGGKYV